MAGSEIVEADDALSGAEQALDEVGADEPRRAGDQPVDAASERAVRTGRRAESSIGAALAQTADALSIARLASRTPAPLAPARQRCRAKRGAISKCKRKAVARRLVDAFACRSSARRSSSSPTRTWSSPNARRGSSAASRRSMRGRKASSTNGFTRSPRHSPRMTATIPSARRPLRGQPDRPPLERPVRSGYGDLRQMEGADRHHLARCADRTE